MCSRRMHVTPLHRLPACRDALGVQPSCGLLGIVQVVLAYRVQCVNAEYMQSTACRYQWTSLTQTGMKSHLMGCLREHMEEEVQLSLPLISRSRPCMGSRRHQQRRQQAVRHGP